MNRSEALEKVLASYRAYFNIKRPAKGEPFDAEAEFIFKDEQYFLIKAAKLSEINAREHVFFAIPEKLDLKTVTELDRKAWETGLSRVKPGPTHRNTDVTLVILTDGMTAEAAEYVRRIRHYRSYRLGLHGWSNYRLIVYDLSSGKTAHNRLGGELKKTIDNIFSTNL